MAAARARGPRSAPDPRDPNMPHGGLCVRDGDTIVFWARLQETAPAPGGPAPGEQLSNGGVYRVRRLNLRDAPGHLGASQTPSVLAARDHAAVMTSPGLGLVGGLLQPSAVEGVGACPGVMVGDRAVHAARRPRSLRVDASDAPMESCEVGVEVGVADDRADPVSAVAAHHVDVVGHLPRTIALCRVRDEHVEASVAVDIGAWARHDLVARVARAEVAALVGALGEDLEAPADDRRGDARSGSRVTGTWPAGNQCTETSMPVPRRSGHAAVTTSRSRPIHTHACVAVSVHGSRGAYPASVSVSVHAATTTSSAASSTLWAIRNSP